MYLLYRKTTLCDKLYGTETSNKFRHDYLIIISFINFYITDMQTLLNKIILKNNTVKYV